MLTIRQIMMASKERIAKRERALFYWEEYMGFEDINAFAEFFRLTLEDAIHQVTFGRRVNEEGVTPA